MPSTASRKRVADQDTYEEDDFVENDDGRAAKKSKRANTSSGASGANVKSGVQKDDEGLEYWEFTAFLEALPAIERVLRNKGETVPRPNFDDVGDDVKQDEDNEEEESEETDDKRNFEATSDEDN
ncbi:MAG: hypothetical protein Q9165_004853 [Trypethelium subeluteriae]